VGRSGWSSGTMNPGTVTVLGMGLASISPAYQLSAGLAMLPESKRNHVKPRSRWRGWTFGDKPLSPRDAAGPTDTQAGTSPSFSDRARRERAADSLTDPLGSLRGSEEISFRATSHYETSCSASQRRLTNA